MINITYEFVANEIVAKYTKEARQDGGDISQFVFYSDNKKDLTKNGEFRTYFLNVDNYVRDLVKQHDLRNGFVVCTSKHTTSSVYINHFEKGIMSDLNDLLNKMYPPQKKYKHNEWDSEYKNAYAHLKAMHLGKGVTVIVKDGELILGDFENIIYAEFDARDGKSFTVSLFGE